MTWTEQDCSPGRTGEIRAVDKELVQTRVVIPQTHLTCQRSLWGRRVRCGGRRQTDGTDGSTATSCGAAKWASLLEET